MATIVEISERNEKMVETESTDTTKGSQIQQMMHTHGSMFIVVI